ncbi:MAG TPA: hypothetical protein VFQ50_00745 [Flavobacterium sp.]|jgi:hypothetical protein|nr:hypothetical protein [Flavobacterium sp.]
MKKVFLFLSAISLVAISSCGDDESPVTPPVDTTDDVLVKRVTTQQEDPDGFNYTIDYTYNGNKLVQGVYTDGSLEKYYYTGDLITKIEYYNDGVLDFQDVFAYNAQGKLTEYRFQWMSDNTEEKSLYVYNSDNTVTETQLSGPINGTGTTGSQSILSFENGELSQIVNASGSTYTYSYDAKNSPFKNVTGYAEIAHAFVGDYQTHGRSKNILSIVNETFGQNYTTNSIQYNADNYPTVVSSTAIFFSENPNFVEELTTTYLYQ